MEKLIIPATANNQLECWPPNDRKDKTSLIIEVKHPAHYGKRAKTVRTHFFLSKEESRKLGEHLLRIADEK